MSVLVLPPLDDRDREEQRYAVYSVDGVEAKWSHLAGQREIAATPTLEGIGPMLALLREEEQITSDTRVGILDRVDRTWIINPWAKGNR